MAAGSEPACASDRQYAPTRPPPTPDGDDWRASGSKSWVTHGGHADYYPTFLRTSDERSRGIS